MQMQDKARTKQKQDTSKEKQSQNQTKTRTDKTILTRLDRNKARDNQNSIKSRHTED